jgi:hypothetical protein
LAWAMAFFRPLDGQRILGPDVDVGLGRADGVGGDGHALEQPVRIALDDRPVHERAGIALVGVADQVLLVARCCQRELPLPAGGEAAAAAPAQPALDFHAEQPVTRRLAGLDFEHLFQFLQYGGRSQHMTGRTAANLDVVFAQRLKAKLVIKGGYPVNLAGRHIQALPDFHDSLAGKISLLLLYLLQDRDQAFPAAAGIFRKYLLNSW